MTSPPGLPDQPLPGHPPPDRPLVVAANRLPVVHTPDGWVASPGGLVRALLPTVQRTGGCWVGWTGRVSDPDEPPTDPIVQLGVEMYPVPLSADDITGYYEGFSNDTLWPLYHDAIRDSGFHSVEWDAYATVNARFAERIAAIAPEGAAVWLHDYQLQLVPALLRAARPDVLIGWFNHIPWPPIELFQRLPWRTEIVEGLLGADVLGFQRERGARNFVVAAERLGGAIESRPDTLTTPVGHTVQVGHFPIAIDTDELELAASGRDARRLTAQLRTRLGDPEVILLGVDRLDYTKGIGSRLRAIGDLLDAGRLDPTRHVMVQVATPSREGVEQYQEERHEIEQLVGEINGRHARLGFPVVHYLYRTLPLDELLPLYRAADVMLVTPIRDGMNLVAKEYVAAHTEGDGVLVLSEFTGAADELDQALLVNPHDTVALQQAIVDAVAMDRHERRARMHAMRDVVRAHDVHRWAASFLDALLASSSV
ncbi:MAG TPA: trehalose-6-phosphate synthase [Ilumatobacter sp.]|nr:trehalose-6-phosphate synthase [Ilumatobacter sp.]